MTERLGSFLKEDLAPKVAASLGGDEGYCRDDVNEGRTTEDQNHSLVWIEDLRKRTW